MVVNKERVLAMKRFKVFKIIYYAFAIVIGIIFCFILPSYNQYNQYVKAIKNYIEDEQYSEVARLNAPYVNANEVAYVEGTDGAKGYIYETITAQPVDFNSNSSHAEQTYVGFVFYPTTYKYAGTVNASGETEYKRGIRINNLDTKIEIDETSFYYINDLNFFYFEITKSQFLDLGIDSINKLSLIDNEDKDYLVFNNLNLNYRSEFYDLTDPYVGYVSQYYTNIEMTIKGEASYSSSGTTFKSGTKITYSPFAAGTMKLNTNNLNGIKITGAEKIENSDSYKLNPKNTLEIEFEADRLVESVLIEYGSIDVVYGFNGQGTYYIDSDIAAGSEKKLGVALDEDKVVADYNNWKEEYAKRSSDGFLVYDNSKITKKATIWTIVQVVIYAVVILVIGDLLVGKRHIITFFSRLFGKRGPMKEEDVQIVNDYEVNVACTAFVPVGYTEKIAVLYAKENGEKMIFELDAQHNYKMAKKFKNGQYEFQGLEAKGLHLIKTNRKINVRGYRFELVLNLAYDEISPEVSQTAIPEEASTEVKENSTFEETKE